MKFFQQFREDLDKQRRQIASFKEKGQKITSDAAETRSAAKEAEKNAKEDSARRKLERQQDRESIRRELESKR